MPSGVTCFLRVLDIGGNNESRAVSSSAFRGSAFHPREFERRGVTGNQVHMIEEHHTSPGTFAQHISHAVAHVLCCECRCEGLSVDASSCFRAILILSDRRVRKRARRAHNGVSYFMY